MVIQSNLYYLKLTIKGSADRKQKDKETERSNKTLNKLNLSSLRKKFTGNVSAVNKFCREKSVDNRIRDPFKLVADMRDKALNVS